MTGVPDPSVRDRVTAILTLAEAATSGEWQSASWNAHTILPKLWAEDELPTNERGPFTAIYTTKDEDAAYIVAACNGFPDVARRLLEALDTIDKAKALHRAITEGPNAGFCVGCGYSSPCATEQALNGGNESGDDG